MTPAPLRIARDGAVARVTLTRPDVRNAFDDTLIAALTQAFTTLGADPTLRCIVLAADGPAFCAGADLNWMRRMAGYSHAENMADAGALAAMLRSIAECPVPTVARVQGDAIAGGMGLVAACDIAVCTASAGFCLSEVKFGLIPATIGPYVVRAMGARAAHRYFLTAERFDAAEALRIGFVHAVTPDNDAAALDAQVDALAKSITGAGPAAARACKRLLHDIDGAPIDDALVARTVAAIADIRASDEGREGVQSFLQKRRPGWLTTVATPAVPPSSPAPAASPPAARSAHPPEPTP